MKLDARAKLFLFLTTLFVTALVVGDIIGGKLFIAFGITMSVGMIPFPVTFLLTDLLNEFYGKRSARLVTFMGMAAAIFTILILMVAVEVPFAPFTFAADWGGVTKPAFDQIFAASQKILIASVIAYVIAQFIDIGIFHMLKRLTRNRFLWLRATGSTVVSQAIDTAAINLLVWTGTLPFEKIVAVAAASYVGKLAIAVALTPAVYAGHALVERVFGIRPVVLGADGEPVDEPPAWPPASA